VNGIVYPIHVIVKMIKTVWEEIKSRSKQI